MFLGFCSLQADEDCLPVHVGYELRLAWGFPPHAGRDSGGLPGVFWALAQKTVSETGEQCLPIKMGDNRGQQGGGSVGERGWNEVSREQRSRRR